MKNSIYSPTGKQRFSSVCLEHTKNWGTAAVVDSNTNLDQIFNIPIAATGGSNTLVSGISGRQIAVQSYTLVASGASNVKFLSNSTDLTGSMSFSANGGIAINNNNLLFKTNSGESLVLQSSNIVSGHLSYRIM